MSNRDFNFAKPFAIGPQGGDRRQSSRDTNEAFAPPQYEQVEEYAKPTMLSRDEGYAKPTMMSRDEGYQPQYPPPQLRPQGEPSIDYRERPLLTPQMFYAPEPVDPKLAKDFEDLDNLMEQDINTLASQATNPFKPGRTDGRELKVVPESTAVPGKFMPPEENVTDQDFALKLQVLVDKLKEYQDRLRDLKSKNLELSKNNYEKQQQIQAIELEKFDLEKQIEAFGIDVNDNAMNNLKFISKRDFDAEEAKRRADMKRELMMGIALVDEVGDLGGRSSGVNSAFQKIVLAIQKFALRFVLLKSDVKHIEARYDKSISAYFNFYKHLVNASILVGLIYTYLLVNHVVSYSGSYTSVCGGSLCLPQWHTFGTDESFTYAISLAAFILMTLVYGLVKWIRVDYYRTRSEIYGGKDAKLKKFAAIIFNPWDWTINEDTEAADQTVNLTNQLTTAITDELRLSESAKRTPAQKSALFFRKIAGFSVNILFLFAGFIGIFFIAINEGSLASLFDGSSASLVGTFIPKLGISFINSFIPVLTMRLTLIEKWDDPADLTKVQIFRLYASKILNVALYAVLNVELAANYALFSSESSIEFKDSDFNCREDQAGLNLLLFVVSEFFVGKIAALSFPILDYLKAKCKKTAVLKREIQTSRQIINAIYFQSLIWITYPFSPYVAWVAPIFLLIDFKFQVWRLNKLQQKPKQMTQASDMSIFIMRFYNITIILLAIYISYVMSTEMFHNDYPLDTTATDPDHCGPFDNNESFIENLEKKFLENELLKFIWQSVLDYALLAWAIAIILLVLTSFKSNYTRVAKGYINDKEAETGQVINDLQRANARLRKQLQFNKKLASD